jgi:hypothetical protein
MQPIEPAKSSIPMQFVASIFKFKKIQQELTTSSIWRIFADTSKF